MLRLKKYISLQYWNLFEIKVREVVHLSNVYRIFSNLIHTSFCRFLKKKKKKLLRGSNPHLSFKRPLPTRQTDWIILDVYQCFNRYPTNASCVKWSFNCERYKRTTADDSDWVTDNDSVMSDDGESDE